MSKIEDWGKGPEMTPAEREAAIAAANAEAEKARREMDAYVADLRAKDIDPAADYRKNR